MNSWILDLHDIDRRDTALAGGKGANLGELSRVGGIHVPRGFCITTDVFARIIATIPSFNEMLDRLAILDADDRAAIRGLSTEIRRAIDNAVIPPDIASAIARAVARLGEDDPYAVRSSATAEDLPTASFAGQQDSFLNVTGPTSILQYVGRCWASLFSERAVTYRLRNGFDARSVRMAVIVQRMVAADVSGVLFTADPVSGNRHVSTVEAVRGLGEALVSGRAMADAYAVRNGIAISRVITGPSAALSDEQLARLAGLGRRIEAHFGRPQDIEWCLSGNEFHIVQSRPITTLFPIPERQDDTNHVYVSVGHQQMMTDAMKPLGLSVWQMTTPRRMAEAGGRLFVDVTQALASPASRDALLTTLGKSDPRIRDALQSLLDRGDFVQQSPDEGPAWTPPGGGAPSPVETDPAIVTEMISRSETVIATLKSDIRTRSGSDLLDFIRADLEKRKQEQFDPRSLQVIMAGMEAAWWLNDHMQQWLGETNAADVLTQSVPNNVTSAMGLALLDVADVIRPHLALVEFLERSDSDDFLDELPRVDGGPGARDAILAWLDEYGMRGPGEIDITRPRWRERPTMLLPVILANVRNFAPGEARRRFEQGLAEARKKEAELLARLRTLPDGEQKAQRTKAMIDRVRTFAGYREYPKYAMVSRYFVYKQALLAEARRLVQAGVLDDEEDIYFLRFDELYDLFRNQRVDHQLIHERRDAFRSYESLTPPRVLTSDGEMLSGRYRRDDVPAGALVGLPVSTGIAEGRARVILDMTSAGLEAGDILVTAYTDPSWTPLFVAIAGLVTEVGGLMTHGAVIAREYGLPAVVGVENATQLIRDGDHIRVDGASGTVEIVSRPPDTPTLP